MKKLCVSFLLLMLFAVFNIAYAQMGPRMGPQTGQGQGMKQNPKMRQQQSQSITEEQAKTIVENYIAQNQASKFVVTGYAIFETARGANSYVFEMESGDTKYMMYINPNGLTIGPSPVKKY